MTPHTWTFGFTGPIVMAVCQACGLGARSQFALGSIDLPTGCNPTPTSHDWRTLADRQGLDARSVAICTSCGVIRRALITEVGAGATATSVDLSGECSRAAVTA